jgi:hypothetical protein
MKIKELKEFEMIIRSLTERGYDGFELIFMPLPELRRIYYKEKRLDNQLLEVLEKVA